MRLSRLMLRVATLLLALWLPLTGLRGAAFASCDADGDCELPCCDRDAGRPTVVPVLPCCGTRVIDGAPSRPAQLTVDDARPL